MICSNCKTNGKSYRSYVCKNCRRRFCDVCADSFGYTCPDCMEEMSHTT